MKLLKMWYHFKASVKKMLYRIVFGKKLYIGRGTTWRDGFHVAIEGGRIEIGENCFFNHNCSVNSLEHISIGEGTIFGENCHVYDHNHRFRDSEQPIKEQGYRVAETVIGKHCWIGTNVVILKGVHIGDYVTIGAGCVVEEDVPEGSVVRRDQNRM